jgi:hypothetical protein
VAGLRRDAEDTDILAHPENGLLGYEQALLPSPIIVQYWRSFEDPTRFAT